MPSDAGAMGSEIVYESLAWRVVVEFLLDRPSQNLLPMLVRLRAHIRGSGHVHQVMRILILRIQQGPFWKHLEWMHTYMTNSLELKRRVESALPSRSRAQAMKGMMNDSLELIESVLDSFQVMSLSGDRVPSKNTDRCLTRDTEAEREKPSCLCDRMWVGIGQASVVSFESMNARGTKSMVVTRIGVQGRGDSRSAVFIVL
jgi:hypothetical protein